MPQARVQWQTAEQMIESFVPVPMIDAPVPQMVEQLVGVLKLFDKSLAEQVIEVPKIPLQDAVPHRASLREPQLAEQLVEVPTVVSHSSLQQQIAEQNEDVPVPGRGFSGYGGLQGFHSGQSFLQPSVE